MHVPPHRIFQFERFELDTRRRLLLCEGQPVALQAKALDLLVALVQSDGQLLSKDDLLDKVWPGQIVEESNLTVHISALRKALGEHRGERRFIVTEAGRGYRFVAEVTKTSPSMQAAGEGVSERHDYGEPTTDGKGEPTPASAMPTEKRVAEPEWLTSGMSHSRRLIAVALIASLGLTSIAVIVTRFSPRNRESSADAVQQFRMSRVTNSGNVMAAALAPDGKYAAYVMAERDGHSLWVQQIGTASAVRILSPMNAEFWGVAFSPDGAYLYYNLFAGDRADVDLFRVPSLGGVPQRIPNVSAPAFALSPDGKSIAHTNSHAAIGKTYLQLTDASGGSQRQVAEHHQPYNFEIRGQVLSWSPDGKTLAAIVNHFGHDIHYSSVIGVDVGSGAERALSAERWYDVSSLQWLPDGSGLFLVASDDPLTRNQVWHLSYPSGVTRRITNDVSHYSWLGVTGDGRTLLTVQTNAVNALWVGTTREVDPLREVISESGSLGPFAWLPGGRIVFRSDTGGGANLWMMNAEGTAREQLSADAQASARGMCASPDGKRVVFPSWRTGKLNLWRLDVATGHLAQLTSGDGEAYPNCSADGRWVVYQSGLGIGTTTVWRTPLEGGNAERLVATFGVRPVLSNDGERLAYFFMDEAKWRIGVIPSDGGALLQALDLPASVAERVMRWSPDDKALYYVSRTGAVGNVWALPLDGAAAQPITRFTSRLLDDFVFSDDGSQLAVTRGSARRDVVLLGASE